MSLFSRILGGNKNRGGGASNTAAFVNKLTTDLHLSPEQAAKVEAAIREFMQERKSVKQSGGGKEQMRESKQDFKQDILAVLDPAQQQKFMSNIQVYKDLLKGR